MNTFEKGPEQVPTKELIMEKIAENMGGLKFEVTRELEDEQGVYFLEIMTEADSTGHKREYTFSRKSLKTGAVLPPAIYVAFYDDEMPVGGEDVCKF